MIEKFYAAHIKTMLDATAINVRKGVIQHERKTREGGRESPALKGRQVRNGGRTNTLRRERNKRESATDQP
jgi:hypothetical protein